jgi:hypothetical protein
MSDRSRVWLWTLALDLLLWLLVAVTAGFVWGAL